MKIFNFYEMEVKNQKKYYAVIEGGGYSENSWENIIGVCSTLELADELKSKVQNKLNTSECSISEEEWNNMWESLCEEEVYDIAFSMKEHFPQYSEEDLDRATRLYDDYYIRIEEIDFYASLSDFK